MTRRLWVPVLYFLALWFFLGALGLFIALIVLVVWFLHLPKGFLWASSVILLTAAPFAILAQGLPKKAIVGIDFASRHWVAHVLVAMALALAGLAGILELVPQTAKPSDPVSDVVDEEP